ncbi:nuclear fragile X mental retardation-interacting protein 1-domain-containing protein [Chlamydoabsidia padenii]|nr:nuclear fragile X mental retardation-interacting protein 1-domain-containing protein [Chlamydoabsidia padenii]
MNFWDQPDWQQHYQQGQASGQRQTSSWHNVQQQQHNMMLNTLQQQTQQRHAQGALAAASLTSFLQPSTTQPFYPTDTWTAQYQRGVVPYDDISTTQAQTSTKEEEESGGSCCFRYYKTQKALEQHRSGHVACTECSDFVGIRQLLQDHMETTHGAPKKNKKSIPDGVVPANAPRLDTPEAIAAWIQERKKNWPSLSNVERKKKQEEERAARGELKRNNNKKRKEQPSQQDGLIDKKARNTLVNYDDSDTASVNDDGDDDDTMDLNADAISSKDPTSMGKLAIPTTTTTRPKKLCKYFMRGKCRRADTCHFSHEKPKQTQQQAKGKQQPVDQFRKRPHLLKMVIKRKIG